MPSEPQENITGATVLPEVSGYEVIRLLRAGPRSFAYGAVEDAGGRKVVLKLHRADYPSERELAADTRAFDIAHGLQSDSLAEHLALVPKGADLVTVTEDINAISLDLQLRQNGAPGIETCLEIGVALAGALADLHDRGVIHNDVTPSNILWSREGSALKLIDLKECSLLDHESLDAGEKLRFDKSLIYAAPEQSGRMGKSVDARSDLYSVGVTLFELLAGRPPFEMSDERELLHAHLARTPPDVCTLVPAVPAVLGAIIAKLLSKDPEQRYASARGLAHDLKRCLSDLRGGNSENFELGAEDKWARFSVHDRLFGREQEVARLLAAFYSASGGHPQTLLIAGYSGVGKSALVREVRAPIAECHGWFCAGKFDQFRRDKPYLAWSEALARLLKQLLAEPEAVLEQIRAEVANALAGNGALIGELVPEIETLLGPQPPVPDVSPGEAQARFIQTFKNFIHALARPDHPLVIFVDDLQWADLASLQLLEALAAGSEPANLMVLGAYRDNETGPGHPLIASIDRLADQGHEATILELPPLAEQHVTMMVADTIHTDVAEVAELGRLVHQKTEGNPFFVNQFLLTLHKDGLLTFDTRQGNWQWDLAAIAAAGFTDNVVSFMSKRVGLLPDATREILQFGSCLGTSFDLNTLASLAGKRHSYIAEHLEDALQAGLIVPRDSDYRLARTQSLLAESNGVSPALNPRYSFLHDRVQASIHDRIAPSTRAGVHLQIARQRVTDIARSGHDEEAVEAMDHLHEAIELIEDRTERITFARLCLAASLRAKAAMATPAAAGYLQMGRSLLPDDAWDSEGRLALDLHLQAAETAYIGERFDEAQRLGSLVLERAEHLDDRVAVHNILIGIGVAQRRYVEATHHAIDVLKTEFDVTLPRAPSMARVLADIVKTRSALARHSPESLLDLREMTDPGLQAAMTILMKSATNAYWGIPNLVPIIAGTMVRLSIKYGNIGLSAYGYALSGMVMTNAVGAVDIGYRLGKLSMDLLERTGDRHLIGKTGLLWHGFIRHSTDPLRLCAADILECYDHALDAGDVENAVYCGTVAYYADLLSGRPLDWVEARYSSYLPALLESAQEQTILSLKVWIQAVENLHDREQVQPRATGRHVDWPAEMAVLAGQDGTDTTISIACGASGWLALLLDDWEEAERQFRELYARPQAALGQTYLKPSMALYGLVLQRKLARGEASLGDRTRLTGIRRSVRKWARQNAHDFAGFDALLEAEAAALNGQNEKAIGLWSEAMECARESQIGYLEAWSAERAALAHGKAGHAGLARYMLDRASEIWEHNGFWARLGLLNDPTRVRDPAEEQPFRAVPGRKGVHDLNFGAVLGAVRAVSESIETDQLVKQILELAVLNSGARRGVLLIEEGGLRPIASARLDDNGNLVADLQRFEASPENLPMTMVDYIVRTREVLLIEDARTHEWLARDSYVIQNGCRSLMGAPLIRQAELVGLVILENDLGSGVFSQSDTAVVETIAGQAAISLENARLFEAQRRRTEAFARFVPRPFLEQLGHDQIEDVLLGEGVQRHVTVMFVDLRGSTNLSESMSIPDYFGLMNAFLAQITPAVREEGGFVDGFTGDGLMAAFVDNADGAVRAATAMHRRLRRYNKIRREKDRVPLGMGVGLHTGSALMGTIGVQDRMTTSMTGETVITAARIEGLTKFYEVPVLLSNATRQALEDPLIYDIRRAGRDRVMGRQGAVTVHELVDARSRSQREAITGIAQEFSNAMELYLGKNFEAAAEGFTQCVQRAPADNLSQMYLDQARLYLVEGVPEDWDGTINRREK